MTLVALLGYCFLFGLLHGILPDEHTWPITFSYAIGGGTSRAGMRAGIYFSGAFTMQRMIISELSYLALAPFLRLKTLEAVVYIAVGIAMSLAGWVLLYSKRYSHIHLMGHHHEKAHEIETSKRFLTRHHAAPESGAAPPLKWTLIHGFIAGFGFGGFALFVNTVAAPAMPSAWIGFMPGLLYGLGTITTLAAIGAFFGASLRFVAGVSEENMKRVGARVGATTLFFGGFLFAAAGVAILCGVERYVPLNLGYLVIALFVVAVAIPALVSAIRHLPEASEAKGSGQIAAVK